MQVMLDLTIDADIETFNETGTRYDLAAAYGMPVDYIVIEASAGSMLVHVVITLPSSSGFQAQDVLSQVAAIGSAALSAALGMNLTVSVAPTLQNITHLITESQTVLTKTGCEPGYWCSAGYVTACLKGVSTTHAYFLMHQPQPTAATFG